MKKLTFIFAFLFVGVIFTSSAEVISICRVCVETNLGGCERDGGNDYCKPNSTGPACCSSVVVEVPQ